MAKFFAGILLAVISTSLSAQELDIRVSKGQKFKVENYSLSVDTGTFNGVEAENKQEYNTTKIFEIKEVDKNRVEIILTTTRSKGKSSFMGFDAEYDSDRSDNDASAAPLLAMVNKPNKIIIDRTGKVIEQPEPGKDESGVASLAWFYQRPEIELFIPFLVGKKMKEGDRFPYHEIFRKEKPSTNFLAAKENSVTTDAGEYVVTSVAGDIATLIYKGRQEIITNLIMGGNSITSQQNGEVQSTIKIDLRTGTLIEKTVEMNMKMAAGSGGSGQVNTSGGKIKSTTTISLME